MGSLSFATENESEVKPVNERPVIGILSQESEERFANYGKTYIAASYVKFIESAGARVVPIFIDSSKEELQTLFNCINGVVLPGGNIDLFDSGYLKTGEKLYDLAVKACDAGDRFPLWAVCLGFEMLGMFASGLNDEELLESCDALNYSIPLEFTSVAFKSKMFGPAPPVFLKTLKEKKVSFNGHSKCITVKKFWENKCLSGFYDLLSTNKDRNGLEFISTIEGKTYPFFATQWHPEKALFEWAPDLEIDHSSGNMRVGQYLANFFVDQARHNSHKFTSAEEEEKALIYNYNPTYSSRFSGFQQCYFFD